MHVIHQGVQESLESNETAERGPGNGMVESYLTGGACHRSVVSSYQLYVVSYYVCFAQVTIVFRDYIRELEAEISLLELPVQCCVIYSDIFITYLFHCL